MRENLLDVYPTLSEIKKLAEIRKMCDNYG